MQSSVARMAGLIDDVLDFARGRLGGGLDVERGPTTALAPVARAGGRRAARGPARPARSRPTIALDRPVRCDRARIGQLLSNLLANALTHGAADGRSGSRRDRDDGAFELSVANAGEPIPPDDLGAAVPAVRPRAEHAPHQQGLGLGLYIASEIAKAHRRQPRRRVRRRRDRGSRSACRRPGRSRARRVRTLRRRRAPEHFTLGFQSANRPDGFGVQFHTCRYQKPSESARFRFWPMIVGGSAFVQAVNGTRYSTPFNWKRAVRPLLVDQHFRLLDVEGRVLEWPCC